MRRTRDRQGYTELGGNTVVKRRASSRTEGVVCYASAGARVRPYSHDCPGPMRGPPEQERPAVREVTADRDLGNRVGRSHGLIMGAWAGSLSRLRLQHYVPRST